MFGRGLIGLILALTAAPWLAAQPGNAAGSEPDRAAIAGSSGTMSAMPRVPAYLEDDPAPFLGLTLADAIVRLGAPSSVYSVRGTEAWQDDVAFAYTPGYTLFWYGDRLWQLRFAAPYSGSVYGLFLGDAADKVYSTLGSPYERIGDSLFYRMPYRGYPVRLRIVLTADKVTDVYLYRADF